MLPSSCRFSSLGSRSTWTGSTWTSRHWSNFLDQLDSWSEIIEMKNFLDRVRIELDRHEKLLGSTSTWAGSIWKPWAGPILWTSWIEIDITRADLDPRRFSYRSSSIRSRSRKLFWLHFHVDPARSKKMFMSTQLKSTWIDTKNLSSVESTWYQTSWIETDMKWVEIVQLHPGCGDVSS